MSYIKKFAFLSVLFLLIQSFGFSAYFYLSTEKSFQPGEAARIKIESLNTPKVTARLYKVPNPEAFVQSRENINRVYVESDEIRANPTEIVINYMNAAKDAFKAYGRERIADSKTRHTVAMDFTETLQPGTAQHKIMVGRMKGYEFIKEFQVDLAKGENWSYSYIDYGSMESGLYLAEVFSENSIAYTLVHVSKTGMVIKKSDTRLLIRTVDKESGAPVPAEVTVTDFSSGKAVKTGKTGVNGIFDFTFKKNQYSELLVTAKGPSDFTFYKISLSPAAETERLVYLYTDSPIYKFGQTAHIKGIVRDFKNSRYEIPAKADLSVTIIDPRGGSYEADSGSSGDFGTFETLYAIDDGAPTGIYKVLANVDGKTYSGEFRVENYVKPRFKVALTAEKNTVVGSQTVKFKIQGEYFTGGPVKGGNVNYSIFRTPIREDIFESSQDIFEDPAYASKLEFLDSQSGKLDDNGNFSAEFKPSKYGTDRDYAYIIKAEIADDSMARGNATARIKVVKTEFFMSASAGKSVYLSGEDVRTLVKLAFASGEAASNKTIAFKAVLEENNRILSEGKVTTDVHGNAVVSFKANGKGFLHITMSVKDSYGNTLTENAFTWIGQDGGTFVYTSGDISIVFDKDEYKAGDKARVLVVSPVPKVNALFASEREEVFDYKLLSFEGNTKLLEIPITKEMTPNFFYSVLFVFNNTVYENTVKIKVPPADKILNVKITPEKTIFAPRDRGVLNLEVTDMNGKPVQAELSVSVIDEALYRLAGDLYPDIRLFFYAYRWDSVSTMNSIALRFYGYSRELREKTAMNYYKKKIWDFEDFLTRMDSRYAGMKDANSKINSLINARKVFKDQILWEGMVKTDAKGQAKVNVEFPDNLTEWRVTTTAVTKDTRVGRSTASVKTSKDFFVQLNVPEVVTYADKAKAYLTVVNNTSQDRSTRVTVNVENGKSGFASPEMMVPANSQSTVSFDFTPGHTGLSRFQVQAVSGSLNDAVEQAVQILPISLKKVIYDRKLISSASDVLTFQIPPTAMPESVNLTAGLLAVENPFGVVAEALPYLKSYPYGCVEQTVSSFLPDLIAFESAKKLNLNLPQIFNDKDAIMDQALAKIAGYQYSDGTWGWWNEDHGDAYMTAYVLYALNFVKKTYPAKLNQSMYDRGVQALEKMVQDGIQNDGNRIYALYILSECGVYYKDMIDKIAANPNTAPYFLAYLTLAAKNNGLKDKAAAIAKKLDAQAQTQDFYSYWNNSGDKWYGQNTACTAVCLRAVMASGIESKNIVRAASYLIYNRKGNAWTSTRDTAEAVYAVSEYAAAGYAADSSDTADVVLNGKVIGAFNFGKQNYRSSINIPSDTLSTGKPQTLNFKVSGGNFIGDFRLEYFDTGTTVEKFSQGLSIDRKYYRVTDKNNYEAYDGAPVKAGDVLLVELNASASKPMDFTAIEDGIPAGFMPVQTVNEYNLGIKFYDQMAHYEFGTGKASFFYKRFQSGKIYYLIQAIYPGTYYAPPAQGFAMYSPDDRGNSDSTSLTVEE